MKTIQVSNKNQTKLSLEAKTLLAQRDIACENAKNSNDIELIR